MSAGRVRRGAKRGLVFQQYTRAERRERAFERLTRV
jgi:hypothetical protein